MAGSLQLPSLHGIVLLSSSLSYDTPQVQRESWTVLPHPFSFSFFPYPFVGKTGTTLSSP